VENPKKEANKKKKRRNELFTNIRKYGEDLYIKQFAWTE